MDFVGILWDVATRLFGCGKIHAAYVYKLKENLESLEQKRDDLDRRCADVKSEIDDLERTGDMRRTKVVKGWLQKVDRLQKEMDEAIPAQGSQETRNGCLRGCCPKNCVSNYKLGKKVVKALKDIDKVLTDGPHFNRNNICTNLPPQPVVEMPPVDTIGMDSMFDKVWSNLEDENVGIIGLYGMGGAGKTTLLKRIHNELGRKEHEFDLVLWTVVSKDCDINTIMNDIRNRLGINDDIWNKSSQDRKVAKIYQILKQKKIVLMLDDLWEKLELEMVGVPFSKDTKYQSKILFTTRSEDVCAKMQAQRKFKVKCLSEQEAFALFCQKVGEETLKCHQEISEVAREMAQECGGLPLALITVGSAMAGVNNVEAWRQAKHDLKSSPWIASDMEKKVFSILKFSYDRLPDETHRRCFLYCVLYPEDYEIEIDGLIDRWIGEGFLGKDKSKRSIYSLYEQGKSIIAKLKLSSLLEDVENEDRICSWECAIKMHDVIRDMALWLARDEDGKKEKVVVEGEALALAMSEMDVVERISIINAKGSWQVPACPNLLSLSVQQSSDDMEITDYSNLQCMTRLKVLDLSTKPFNMFNHLLLPQEIGKLINLEFLCLSRRKMIRLPIELKNLKNLRVFLMEYVKVDKGTEKMLSEVIESFERLKVFRFSRSVLPFIDNREDSEEATLIERLESLRELEELGMHLQTVIGLQKLLNSTKLQDCVRYISLSEIRDPLEMASLLESLSRMKHLERIHLYQMPGLMEGSSIAYNCHLRNLRQVNIYDCHSITHLTWLKYAPLLESLEVWRCESMEEVVKGGEDEDTDIFSNLKRLGLSILPKLKSIHNRALPFPLLREIYIMECPNLRKLPLNSNSAKDTLIAIKGELEWWNNLEWEDPAIKDPLHSKFRERK